MKKMDAKQRVIEKYPEVMYVRVSREDYSALHREAVANDESLSRLLRRIIHEHLAAIPKNS